MKLQASDGWLLAKAATDLFFVWANCMECQYNGYVCKDHQTEIEPILKLIGKQHGLVVEDFQIQDE